MEGDAGKGQSRPPQRNSPRKSGCCLRRCGTYQLRNVGCFGPGQRAKGVRPPLAGC